MTFPAAQGERSERHASAAELTEFNINCEERTRAEARRTKGQL